MSETVLKIENLSKLYRLGEVGTGTISHDLNRWFAKVSGKEDPFAKVGQVNDRSKKATSDYVWALKDIGFEVKKGEVLGIIGKNGAGKSTLLKLISQITAPTTGVIKAKGRVASLLEVGTGMHPEMTAKENIYLNGAILGMTKKEIRAKFDEILDFAGCEMYVNTPIKRFSSGMTVRLAFAVAAFLDPEILIVDEVLAVGDADFQKKAIGKMKEVSEGAGRTVIFVSHNMNSVASLCTRGIFLENGMISFEGQIDDVINHYLHSSVQEEAKINFDERKGDQKASFLNYSMHDNNGKELTSVVSGEYLEIKLSIKKNIGFNLGHNVVSIGFFSLMNEFYGACKTDCIGVNVTFDQEVNYVSFVFDEFQLKPGTYKFNLNLLNKNTTSDWIVNAGSIEVHGYDYYGTGLIPARGKTGVLLNYKVK